MCSIQNEFKKCKGCSYQNKECLALMVNAYAKQIISQSTWQRNLPINKENKKYDNNRKQVRVPSLKLNFFCWYQ